MVKRILIISLALKMLKLELIYLIYIFSKYIFLPKIRRYRRDFDETKYMSFLIKYHELLEKYNENWEKVKNCIKKEFDSETVYNEKYQKAK